MEIIIKQTKMINAKGNYQIFQLGTNNKASQKGNKKSFQDNIILYIVAGVAVLLIASIIANLFKIKII